MTVDREHRDDSARPFQLMVASRGAPDGRTIAEQARWAESVGFTHVAVHDHLANRHAVTPVPATVAAVTERVGLVPLVYNNDLRHPAVLAQELASLDVISGGRVVVGLGAGWNEAEYRAIGMQYDPAGTSVRPLSTRENPWVAPAGDVAFSLEDRWRFVAASSRPR